MEMPNTDITVALLEHDAAVRAAVTLCFELNGSQVVAASNGSDLVHLIMASGTKPALIVADYQLGSRTLFDEVPKVIAVSGPDAKVMVSIDNPSPDIRAHIEACGWRLLPKPYHPEDLLASINMDESTEE